MNRRIIQKLNIWLMVTCSFLFFINCSNTSHKREQIRKQLNTSEDAFEKDDIRNSLISLYQVFERIDSAEMPAEYFEAAVMMANIYCLSGEHEKYNNLLSNLTYRDDCKLESYAPQYYYRLKAYAATMYLHDYRLATEMLDSAISVGKRLYGDNPSIALADCANRAEALVKLDRWEEAQEQINELEKNDLNNLIRTELIYVKASLSSHRGDYLKAYQQAVTGYHLADSLGIVDNAILCLKLLCHLDSIEGNLPAYISHQQAYDNHKQRYSLQEIESQRLFAKTLADADMKHQQYKNQRIVTALLIGLLLTVMLGLILLVINIRRQAKAQQHIAELEKQTIEEENLRSRLENELLSLKLDEHKQSLEIIRQDNLLLGSRLAESVDSTSSPDSSLENLEHMLNMHCLDFLTHISHQHPELNANDIRMLGFIRMGIKASTIANALNISTASVNTSRYRLRKKLKLNSDQDLREYLLKL